ARTLGDAAQCEHDGRTAARSGSPEDQRCDVPERAGQPGLGPALDRRWPAAISELHRTNRLVQWCLAPDLRTVAAVPHLTRPLAGTVRLPGPRGSRRRGARDVCALATRQAHGAGTPWHRALVPDPVGPRPDRVYPRLSPR